MRKTEPTYAEALAELEAIVTNMESGAIGVDDLARSVQRAAELIALCRGRLRRAETEVQNALAALRETPSRPDEAVVERAGAVRPAASAQAATVPPAVAALDLDETDPFADL